MIGINSGKDQKDWKIFLQLYPILKLKKYTYNEFGIKYTNKSWLLKHLCIYKLDINKLNIYNHK